MNNNFTSGLKYWFVLGLVSIGIGACSSRDNGDSATGTEGTTLSVNIVGIAESTEIALNASRTKTINTDPQSNTIVKEKMVSFNGFDALVGVEQQPVQSMVKNAVASASGIAGTTAATTSMENNIKYRLVIYDAADVNHIGAPAANVVLTSNEVSSPIRIDAGKKYNWYAFSMNETGALPNIDSSGKIDQSGLINKDVLWGSGNFAAQYGNNDLSITFRRNTTRMQVEVNSLGMFGTIKGTPKFDVLVGGSSILKSGDLNLFDGSYTNLHAFTASPGAPSVTNSIIHTYSLYTVDAGNVATNNLQLKLGGFSIFKRDSNPVLTTTNNNNNTLVNFNTSSIALNNTAFSFSQGNSYKMTVKLVESAVMVGGVRWARSNLKNYDSRLGGYGYFFMADPSNNMDYGGGPNGRVVYFGGEKNVDACLSVFPEGTWRLPTSAEFNRLPATGINVFLVNTLTDQAPVGRGNGFLGIQYPLDDATKVNNNYPQYERQLVFAMAGYNDNGITSGYNITEGVEKGPMKTGYWTKDGTTFRQQIFYTSGNYTYTGTGNGPLVVMGGNVAPGDNISMRCVRNN